MADQPLFGMAIVVIIIPVMVLKMVMLFSVSLLVTMMFGPR